MESTNKVSSPTSPLRTAVLVIHGIGNQRALETVRGVASAVLKPGTKLWLHPEMSGVDVDLPFSLQPESKPLKGVETSISTNSTGHI